LFWAGVRVLGSFAYLVHNFDFSQMVTNGFGAKRDNAGAKKSPQQIQMLEKFYSGNYKLMVRSLFLWLCYTLHCC
jgi:hypothetical protein